MSLRLTSPHNAMGIVMKYFKQLTGKCKIQKQQKVQLNLPQMTHYPISNERLNFFN